MLSSKNFLFQLAIALVIGIAAGYYFAIPSSYNIFLVSIVIISLASGILLLKKQFSLYPFLILFFSFMMLGVIKISSDMENNISGVISKLFEYNKKIIISGIVEESALVKNERISFPLHVTKIFIEDNEIPLSFSALINVRMDTLSKKMRTYNFGDEIFAVGKIIPPKNARNPGEFDYSKYLLLQDIHALIRINSIDDIILRSKENGGFVKGQILEPLKNGINNYIEKNMGSIEGAFLKGLLTGDRSGIPDEVKKDFMNAGVTHVLAVSGLNVVFVILIFSALYSVFISDKRIKTILIIMSLVFYMLLTGSTPSIVRATIMGIIFLLGNMMERKTIAFNMLALSAIIILLIDSRQLFDLGFQLSFLCVFSLIYVYPILTNSLKIPFGNKALALLKESIFGSIAVLLMLFPLLALVSGRVSFISIMANLFVVPLANLSLALGFMQIIIANIFPAVSYLLSAINQLSLWANLSVINYFGNMDFLAVDAYSFGTFSVITYYIFLFCILMFLKYKKYSYIVIILIVILNIIIWPGLFTNKNSLKITFIDVGQGDASLLQLPDGKNVLIDAGTKSDGYDSGEKILYPFLKREGVKKIDYCFISHFHDDHYGGLPYLIKMKMVDTIYYNDSTGFGTLCKYMDSISSENGAVIKKADFNEKRISDLMVYKLNCFDVNHVNNSKLSKNSRENNASLIIKIYYHNTSMLFMGDAEDEVDKSLIKNCGGFLKSDIMKVAHHGSKSGTTDELLNAVKPKTGIIFAGLGNRFKFPSAKVLKRLENNGISVLRTDIDRAIILETDGENIKRKIWN